MNVLKEVILFANTHGFETAEFLGVYKGKSVYTPIYRNDGELYMIELPAYILEKDGTLKWVQNEKSFEIMRYFYED